MRLDSGRKKFEVKHSMMLDEPTSLHANSANRMCWHIAQPMQLPDADIALRVGNGKSN